MYCWETFLLGKDHTINLFKVVLHQPSLVSVMIFTYY